MIPALARPGKLGRESNGGGMRDTRESRPVPLGELPAGVALVTEQGEACQPRDCLVRSAQAEPALPTPGSLGHAGERSRIVPQAPLAAGCPDRALSEGGSVAPVVLQRAPVSGSPAPCTPSTPRRPGPGSALALPPLATSQGGQRLARMWMRKSLRNARDDANAERGAALAQRSEGSLLQDTAL